MKRFLTNLVIYGCLLCCAVVAMQLLLSYRIKGKITSEGNNLVQTAGVNADLVFLGSSRCAMHFDPNYFDANFKIKTVNLGINGHSELTMAITRLKYYLATNKAPKFAVLNIDPFISAANNNNNSALKDEFARCAFFPTNQDSLIADYFKFNFAEKYIPLYSLFKYRQLRASLFPRNTNDFKKYGYRLNEMQWDGVVTSKNLAVKSKFFKKSEIGAITDSLLKLKKLCDENHIKLLCIQTPVYKAVYDTELFSLTGQLCEKSKIPFIDTNTEAIINDAGNFQNINHLNKKGVLQMNLFLKGNPEFISFLGQ